MGLFLRGRYGQREDLLVP